MAYGRFNSLYGASIHPAQVWADQANSAFLTRIQRQVTKPILGDIGPRVHVKLEGSWVDQRGPRQSPYKGVTKSAYAGAVKAFGRDWQKRFVSLRPDLGSRMKGPKGSQPVRSFAQNLASVTLPPYSRVATRDKDLHRI